LRRPWAHFPDPLFSDGDAYRFTWFDSIAIGLVCAHLLDHRRIRSTHANQASYAKLTGVENLNVRKRTEAPLIIVLNWKGGQRDVSLPQVWRAPSERLCHFLLTTSQFTMERCSALLWVAEAEVRAVEESDR